MGARITTKWANKLAVINWLDATGYIGSPITEAKPFPCVTVGWIKEIKRDHIVVATSLYEDGSGDFTVLPKGMITKIKEA